ncbi:VOC family protein [Planctomicrobium piriforme]|uniref:Glyoxalase/Bleomycin resistance protein/Dioxygenase superfamily protein n=1 Tax=Planctomicrobium piriforme TaxID=1576369 RepID=A0A1I3GTC5_9PLAN|nr:VOC family protein [Planctomicrobium piriforme]SFI26601.1 Glyoxalase/Bleomycin resistance protein/Dioxygenase superfamily protein [Planctomicrobium piriforme]
MVGGVTNGYSESTMVKIFRVILPVSDIEQATNFYCEFLGQSGRRVSPGRHYFDCGSVILACFDPRSDGDGFDAKPNPDHLYFAVSDLDAVFERARRLNCQEIEPHIAVRPWGERSFYCKDPFGNPICIVDDQTLFTGRQMP